MPNLEQNNLEAYPRAEKETEDSLVENDGDQAEAAAFDDEGEISAEEWAEKKGYDHNDPLLEDDLDLAKANADRIMAKKSLEEAEKKQVQAEIEKKRQEFDERLKNMREDQEENEGNFKRF